MSEKEVDKATRRVGRIIARQKWDVVMVLWVEECYLHDRGYWQDFVRWLPCNLAGRTIPNAGDLPSLPCAVYEWADEQGLIEDFADYVEDIARKQDFGKAVLERCGYRFNGRHLEKIPDEEIG